MRLVRAELLKIRTTSIWWTFGAIMLPLWAFTVYLNYQSWDATTFGRGDVPPYTWTAAEELQAATGLYTSGQFMGLLLALVLGAILVTNEFQNQTATLTFLVTPRRQKVVGAKFVAAVLGAAALWALTTLGNVLAVPFALRALKMDIAVSDPAVLRAIALNGLAFLLFAIVGVGAGVLLRSQLAASLTLAGVYVLGALGAGTLFPVLIKTIGAWFGRLEVLVPATASQLMVAGVPDPAPLGDPPRWWGAAVLILYAVITGWLGTALLKRRDIS